MAPVKIFTRLEYKFFLNDPLVMCAEAVPWRCHRSLVADALTVRRVPVVEILSESSWRMHELTPFAQVEGMQITYPPEQVALL